MDFSSALAEWNPWWRTGAVPGALSGRPRELTPEVVQALATPEVLAIIGIRRSGKTTMLYQLVEALLDGGAEAERVLFANLEDPALADADVADLVAAHRRDVHPDGPSHVLLDEVQARPGWEAWANTVLERRAGPKIVVSGSTSSLLQGDLGTLLTGRHLTFTVHPLAFREYLAFHDIDVPLPPVRDAEADAMVHHLDSFLTTGGFPEANLRDPALARRLLQQYFHDIVHRDVAHRHGLDPDRIARLATYLAEVVATRQSKRGLARATGLAPDTVRDYLARLEDVFLVQTLPRFTWSPKPSRVDQSPVKVYFADTGLRDAVSSEHVRDTGRLAENLVAETLTARGPRPAYWTDGRGRHEVDFVVPRPGGKLDAYQVTYRPGVPQREVAALDALADAVPKRRLGRLVVLTRTGDVVGGKQGSGEEGAIHHIPLWHWLLEADAEKANGWSARTS